MNINKLSQSEKLIFIEDSLKNSFFHSVEILDCSKSWRRERSHLSYQQIVEKYSQDSYITMLYRNNFDGSYWEVCLSTMESSVEYFLWIYVETELGNQLIDKYKIGEGND